jgi:hypothetical protein
MKDPFLTPEGAPKAFAVADVSAENPESHVPEFLGRKFTPRKDGHVMAFLHQTTDEP